LLDSWRGYVVKQYPGLINPFSTMKLTNAYLYGIVILYGRNAFLPLFVKMFVMNYSVAVYGNPEITYSLLIYPTNALHLKHSIVFA
jgi:hypothetical protein